MVLHVFKGSSDPSHVIYKIQVGKKRRKVAAAASFTFRDRRDDSGTQHFGHNIQVGMWMVMVKL